MINYSEKWDNPKKDNKYITIRIPKLRLPLILGMWIGIGALLGYTITDYVYASNMVC